MQKKFTDKWQLTVYGLAILYGELIDHLYTSKNILIAFLIVVMSWLDALDACENVLQPMGIQWSTVIKQLSQMGNTYYLLLVIRHDLILWTALWR